MDKENNLDKVLKNIYLQSKVSNENLFNFTVAVRPFFQQKQQMTQQELIDYQQQVEKLVQSFFN